jgi:hypothetical protein
VRQRASGVERDRLEDGGDVDHECDGFEWTRSAARHGESAQRAWHEIFPQVLFSVGFSAGSSAVEPTSSAGTQPLVAVPVPVQPVPVTPQSFDGPGTYVGAPAAASDSSAEPYAAPVSTRP